MTLTYRAVKGTALTHVELDGNFTDLDTKITNLIDSAPGVLDTLNELAAAINDDPAFFTTITTSIGTKEPTITAGTTAQYYRGDKSFQTLDSAAVAENTNLYFTTARAKAAAVADAINNSTVDIAPSQNAVFDALALKEDALSAGTTAQYYRGDKTWQTLSTSNPEGSFSVQTTSFNIIAGYRYGVNTAGGAVTATLTASPTAGDAVFFADAGGAYATNNLTIARNGNTIMGSATDMTVSTNNQSTGLFYTGSDWRIY